MLNVSQNVHIIINLTLFWDILDDNSGSGFTINPHSFQGLFVCLFVCIMRFVQINTKLF